MEYKQHAIDWERRILFLRWIDDEYMESQIIAIINIRYAGINMFVCIGVTH